MERSRKAEQDGHVLSERNWLHRNTDREAAHKKAQEWFEKKDEPKKEEVQQPPQKGAKVWPHFVKVVGGGKDDRALFDRIVSSAKNLDLLEKAANGDRDLLKLYRDRRDELNKAGHIQNPDGKTGRIVPLPVDDIAAWLLLGTYPATKVGEGGPIPPTPTSFTGSILTLGH